VVLRKASKVKAGVSRKAAKRYVVHKCLGKTCIYKSDRQPCEPGIYIENEKSEKIWDNKIKYIGHGHSGCFVNVFNSSDKCEEFLKTECNTVSKLLKLEFHGRQLRFLTKTSRISSRTSSNTSVNLVLKVKMKRPRL